MVTTLQANPSASTTINISFTEVNDGAGQPARYQVRYAAGAIGNWDAASLISQGTCSSIIVGTQIGSVKTCTVTGLNIGTTYQFQVIAFRGTTIPNVVYGPRSNISEVQSVTVALPPSSDTFLGGNMNHSTESLLSLYTWPDFQVANAILMKFNLLTLPTGAVVQSALLNLALVESDSATDTTYTVTAHKVTGKNPNLSTATGYTYDGVNPWSPSACCFEGIPLAQSDISAPYDSRVIDQVPGFKSFSILLMAREWLSSSATNFGILLNSDTTKPRDRWRYFASSEEANASLRPYLTLIYQVRSL